MCPVTMSVIAMAGMYGGLGFSMYGQRQQAKHEQKMADFQANLEQQRAGQAQEQANIENMEAAERRRQLVGSGKVAAAAAGGVLDAGPLDAIQMWEQDSEMLAVYDANMLARRAELESWGYMSNASMLKAQGKQARHAARLGMWGTALSGTGQAASMGAQVYSALKSAQA